jgi:hypothetical protein
LARSARRKSSADLEETRVGLIAAARPTAMFGLATQLLLADEGERSAELFVLDDRAFERADLAEFPRVADGSLLNLSAYARKMLVRSRGNMGGFR